MRPEPLPTALPETLGFDAARSRNIVHVLQREVDRGRLPGAVALVARHGQVVRLGDEEIRIAATDSTGNVQ